MNVPEDWGVADKKICMPAEVLSGSGGMPALEGRDVIGFSEFASADFAAGQMKQQPAHGNRKQAAMVRRCDPGFRGEGGKCVPEGTSSPPSSPAQRMEQARKSGARKGPTVKKESQKPKQKPVPEAAPPSKPEPQEQSTPVQEKNVNRLEKELNENTSVESYKSSEPFNAPTIVSNQEFLSAPPVKLIADKEFIDLRQELINSGKFNSFNFPPRYLDVLSQLAVSQATKDGPKITSYVKGAGAGQIASQAGELMTMISSTLSDEQAEVFFGTLEKMAPKGNKSPVDDSWVKAARQNRVAVLNSIKSNLGGGQIIAGSWDVKSEVESLGMNYKDKGFSTDAFFRVKTATGEETILEVSLKKDKNVFFINSGAVGLAKAALKGAPNDHPIKAKISEIESQQQKIADEINKGRPVIPSTTINKSLGEEGLKAKQQYLDLAEESQKLLEEFSKGYNADIYQRNVSKNVHSPMAEEALKDPQAFRDLELFAKQGKLNLAKYIEPLAGKGGTLEEALQAIATTLPEKHGNAHKKLLSKIIDAYRNDKTGQKSEFLERHTQSLLSEYQEYKVNLSKAVVNDPFLKNSVIQDLRSNFPLKSIMMGEEVMAIGDVSLDLKTVERIFGSSNYKDIEQKLQLKELQSGEVILVYSANTDEKEITIATIAARQRGIGYASPVFEAFLHPDFYEEARSASIEEYQGGVQRKNYTKADAKKGPLDPKVHKPGYLTHEEPIMKKQPTYEEYLEILKAKRATPPSNAEGRGANYSDSMVFYRGKALGRCPAGTTRSGRTCVPSTSTPSKAPGYKKQDLGGLSQAQVKALSKAKSTKDIIEAHKKHNKK
jgi:hypothetical protein